MIYFCKGLYKVYVSQNFLKGIKMSWKIIFLPLLVLALSGCISDTKELNVVKSYKSVKQYKTINIVRGSDYGFLNNDLLDGFEDILFHKLYTEKNAQNFIPGEQLSLKYEIVNIQKIKKNFTDWGTYFGKNCNNFEVLFTIYDKFGQEIGLYDVDIDVEFWLFSTNKMAINSAFDTAAYVIAQHLKQNYLSR